MDVKVFWNIRDWADAVAQMPAQGPLPCRTVLVPREPVAHVLRRELIRSDQSKALAGTRFLPPAAAAIEILHEAGVDFKSGEESLRPARILALFRSGLTLSEFPLDLLRSTPGWDEAFARTISALEDAGLRPADLEGSGSPDRLRDVAVVWRAADNSAGLSWTDSRIYSEAAGVLERVPNLWIFPGPTLACAAGDITGVEARFLRAIPGVTLGLLAGRPLRKLHLDRMGLLLGTVVRDALLSAKGPEAHATERDLLVSFLFESPAALADPNGPAAPAPMGLSSSKNIRESKQSSKRRPTGSLGNWLGHSARGDRRSAPHPRLGRGSRRGTHSPAAFRGKRAAGARRGRIAADRNFRRRASAGGRARAARPSLAESLSKVLPALRSLAPDGRHLSTAKRWIWPGRLARSAETPRGPKAPWSGRFAPSRSGRSSPNSSPSQNPMKKMETAQASVAGHGTTSDCSETSSGSLPRWTPWSVSPGKRRAEALRRALARLPSLPQGLAAPAGRRPPGARSSRRSARQAGVGFCLRIARGRRRAHDHRRNDQLPPRARRSIRRTRCLRRIGPPGRRSQLPRGARDRTRRRPVPARAARGSGRPRFSPINLRSVGPSGMVSSPTTAADRALADLHALDVVIRSAQERVALSAPRTDMERSQREPSSVFLEAAAALGRPNSATGEAGRTIPDSVALERDGFEPAREAAAAFRREKPLGEAAWQDGVSSGELGVPPRWSGVLSLDLARIESLKSPGAAVRWTGFSASPT